MKITSGWKIATFVATILSVSACNSGPKDGGADSKLGAKQAEWQKLTSAGDVALKKGDKKEAEKDYLAAVVEAEKLGADTIGTGDATANLANFYYAQGDGAKADELYTKSLAVHEKVLGMEHLDLTKDLIGLARVCHAEKKDDDALKYYARAVSISDKGGQMMASDVIDEYSKLRDAKEPAPSPPPVPGAKSEAADKDDDKSE